MSALESLKSTVPLANDSNNAPADPTLNTPTGNGTPIRVRSFHNMVAPVAISDVSTNSTMSNINIATKGKVLPKSPDEFYRDLQQFHERRATPIIYAPKISGRGVDLHRLYSEVTERGGFNKVNQRDEWDEVLPVLGIRDKCVNASAAIKYVYRRCLEKYERQNFFGEDPDKLEALESAEVMEVSGRSRNRYPTSIYSSNSSNNNINTVPMSYNYRQHIVNMDRRRTYKLSTDLYKPSAYEKLMLSLISPLPNEQDFAINVCSLMANESKNTLKLVEYPKLLDVLLAHTGVFADYTLRKLFEDVYTHVREHSLFNFWRDLLHDKPHILELYTNEQSMRVAGLINDLDSIHRASENIDDFKNLDFLNLGPGEGTQEYVGQRVQQVVAILRNLSFFEENLNVLAKNKSFLRFVVMGANIRWGNLHNQILDIAGNIAPEIELTDPTTDDISRSLLSTLTEGIESLDRGVIINSLETLYKLCQTDSNEEHIIKCLNMKFCETICQFLSLNDMMLLIFTLETIYALTSLGNRPCQMIMQVRGIVDQLVSLVTVEAQSYGPDGCILMRVVETVPGNMLPMVAQNIANLQNAAVIQKPSPQILLPEPLMPAPQPPLPTQVMLPTQHTPPIMPHPQLPTVKLPPIVTCSTPNQQTALDDQVNSSHSVVNTQQQPPQQQPAVAQQNAAVTQQATPVPPQTFTHEDEQYALAWLGAIFERAARKECYIEQQELYRMYLSHCQKFGKHSVVNHIQFPRLVRLIYNTNVGPTIVKCSDGTDLPGLHYVGIRLRSQPLPIQPSKQNPPKTLESKLPTKSNAFENPVVGPTSARKLKKKPKLQQESDSPSTDNLSMTSNTNVTSTTSSQEHTTCETKIEEEKHSSTTTITTSMNITNSEVPLGIVSTPPQCSTLVGINTVTPSVAGQQIADSPQPSSSLIKSLLANKVTQRQQKNQKELNSTGTNTQSQPVTPPNSQQPIKVASTAISALVNNPMMQNTSVKVGQTTIKPLNPQMSLEKKSILESTPPPLAPLSGNNVAKDSSGRPVIIANQMLVDILDKKGGEPPTSNAIMKRKIEENNEPAKRLALDPSSSREDIPVTPSKNAANLYAEMAASILEDEDLEDIPPFTTSSSSTTQSVFNETIQQQQILIPAKIQQASLPAVQRQLVFQSNQPPQLKLTTHTGVASANQLPTAMATIKTDQGLQTVPVILQQKAIEPTQPQQLLQQVITQNIPQPPPQQQPTQYVLATNQQGQTYLVAQQAQPPPPPPPQQTVLVTQMPQQQSTGAKTIIILQQQTVPGQQTQQQQLITGGSQKMIMTTPQGQVVVTQRPQPTLSVPSTQQYFINTHTGTATPIQHVPVSAANVSTNNQLLQRHQILASTQATTIASTQPTTGQISPSLLSQLNHIPATIKLHQPQMPVTTVSSMHQHQAATISRLGKTVSIVQSTPTLAPPQSSIQIPQLQQHQSIIQQHIISGPSDKRQIILGGRAIEIKETVISQTPPPTQQSQLNSQTIITKQVLPQQQQQQQPHQIRTAIEQQQQHPSIIQQKLSLQQQPQKVNEHAASIQGSLPNKSLSIVQTAIQQPAPSQSPLPTINVAPAQQVRAPTPQQPSISTTVSNNKTSGSEPPPLAQTSRASTVSQSQQKDISKANEAANATATFTSTPITSVSTTVSAGATSSTPPPVSSSQTLMPKPSLPIPQLPQVQLPSGLSAGSTTNATPPLDPNWLFVCDWRNCPRRKYKSLNDLQHHACSLHCPDHLDPAAEIFCQWGVGPGLCDGIPRKRFSLMTHIIDRHLTNDSLHAALQRRIATGTVNLQPTQPPVTIVRNVEAAQAQAQRNNAASPGPSNFSQSPSQMAGAKNIAGSSAMQAIKRQTADYVNPKELMEENEGPVTKSIRLTAALILRNLVTYTSTAKRNLRQYEPHLANVASSNVESSGTLSHILFELNN